MKKARHQLCRYSRGGGNLLASIIQNSKFRISNSMLPAATLVMSVLVLALLTAVGIGFGVLILGQIRAARSFDNAVVAELIAQSRLEEVMYLLRKENKVITLGGGCPPNYFSEPSYVNGAETKCQLVGESSMTLDLAENDSVQFDFFPNDALGNNPPDVQGLRFYYSDQNINNEQNFIQPRLEIFIWALRNEGGVFKIETGQGIYNDVIGGRRLIMGSDYLSNIILRFNDNLSACEFKSSDACVFKTLDGANKDIDKNFIQTNIRGYRVRLKSLYNNFHALRVVPLNSGGNQDNSLFFPSPVKIKVTGIYRDSKFTEEVTAATRPSLSGLFDYTLFSPQDIIK